MTERTTFERLMVTAKKLESHLDTDWAYENSEKYDIFAEIIENFWNEGLLTNEQFDELALTAFYDYDGDLKCDYD